MSEEDLSKEIRELNKRIRELESSISHILQPLGDMERAARSYFRLVDLAIRCGGITVDVAFPEVKDSISKDIMRVLIEKNGQNISHITERVKERRGTASRRIIRERLKELEEQGLVVKQGEGVPRYHLTNEVTRRWSQMLGIDI
ncbi:MAG: hypothetical protein KAT70_04125 [Thermoplasmata archaeon]|nr:hypothetical protein [Thermoplasmata archaeon]